MSVLVLAEHNNKDIKSSTLSTISAASQIDQEIHVLVIGFQCEELAKKISKCEKVSKVYLVDNEKLKNSTEQNSANECFEGFSRAMFKLNYGLDRAIFEPVAKGYRALPGPIRKGTGNAVSNLRSLLTFSNNILQGDFRKAGNTAGRFVVNTTVGILGIFDVASKMGFPEYVKEDYGQTFGSWGIGPGCYLVIPVLGPSTIRDTAGLFVNVMGGDPYYNISVNGNNEYLDGKLYAATKMLSAVEFRANNIESFDNLEKNSLDFYASVKSLYLQDRRKKILSVEIMKSSKAKGIKVVTPQKMKETYNENKDRFREESFARIRTLTIRKNPDDPSKSTKGQRTLMDAIQKKLQDGEDFSELAKQYSEDSVAENGGDRGVLGENSIELRRDLKAAAFSLKSNQVSEVLEDNYAFYLIKAEDKTPGQLKTLGNDVVKEEINNLALLDLRRSAYERWMTKLKKTASIRRFDSSGKLITNSSE